MPVQLPSNPVVQLVCACALGLSSSLSAATQRWHTPSPMSTCGSFFAVASFGRLLLCCGTLRSSIWTQLPHLPVNSTATSIGRRNCVSCGLLARQPITIGDDCITSPGWSDWNMAEQPKRQKLTGSTGRPSGSRATLGNSSKTHANQSSKTTTVARGLKPLPQKEVGCDQDTSQAPPRTVTEGMQNFRQQYQALKQARDHNRRLSACA